MSLKKFTLVGALILPVALAACAEGAKAPTADAETDNGYSALGAKGVTGEQRRWLQTIRPRLAGR